MKNKLPVLIFLLLLSPVASGSPARRGVFLLTQPDGTAFKAELKGDEFCRILTTGDGCAVRRDADGVYRYAFYDDGGNLQSTGYAVGEKTPSLILGECRNIPYEKLRARGAARHLERFALNRTASLRTRGDASDKRCIFLLAQFPDQNFLEPGSRREQFISLLTDKGYGGTGSMLDYFDDQFRGACRFTFTVGPIVTLSHDHAYYGENNADGSDGRVQELVKEACRLSDPEVDFSLFDGDGDHAVDNVYVIVAGKSEAEGGGTDWIWPHQWHLQDNLTLDGKRILTYAMSTELAVRGQQSNGQQIWGMCPIGTMCHEYSHTLGLVDFYDTDDEGSGGRADGLWYCTALMDGGGYNNYGKTPPNYNALDRELIGCWPPDTLRPRQESFTLEPIDRSGRYLIYENPADRRDSYLFECRRKTGWDAHIGGSGLVVYHMDMSDGPAGYSDNAGREVTAIYRWNSNEVNCHPEHQCADLMEALPGAMDVSQVFFPYRNAVSFTPATSPAFKFSDGTDSELSIVNIARSGENITFNVFRSSETLPGVSGLNAEVYQDAAILTWGAEAENFSEKAVVTWGETSKGTARVEVSPYAPGKYSLTLEGLSPTTSYTVSIAFSRGALKGTSREYSFLTKARQSGKKPYIYLDYLARVRVDGRFPVGTGLPLRVFNAIGEHVDWYFDGRPVAPDGSGYYPLAKSGSLKAVVSHEDGSKDVIIKEITCQ